MSFPHLTSKKSGINPLSKAQELTLKSDTGFYDVTGTAASPLRGYPLTAAPGSYAEVGTAATLLKGSRLDAAAGAVTWTGTVATEKVGYYLSSQAGSYVETGTDATLNYSLNPSATSLSQTQIRRYNYPRAFAPAVFGQRKFNFVNAYATTGDEGAYVITGTDATFRSTQVGGALNQQLGKTKRTWPRHFAPGPWGHLTNQKSLNRVGSQATSYALNTDSGAWVVTGTDITIKIGHLLAVDSGTWNWNVLAATLNKGGTLVAVPGAFTITSADLTFRVMMPAEVGAWTIGGGTIDLFYSNAPTGVRTMSLLGVG